MALGNIDTKMVAATPQQPMVYRGRDNIVQCTFTQYNGRKFVGLDFSAVTRMVLILPYGPTEQYVFDSATASSVFDWTQGAGLVVFDLTGYGLPVGVYRMQLVVFDAEHTDGQVVVDGFKDNGPSLQVREVYTAGAMPPPLPSGGESVIRTAGVTLSALLGVYEQQGQVYPLDQDDDLHISQFLGIAISAAQAGSSAVIQRSGTIDDTSWAWTVGGLVYLGAGGALTQTAPTTGWELVVGTAPSATRLNLAIQDPVLLAQEQ